MASMILPGLALVVGNTFPYILLGLGAASLIVYAANRQTPSYKLGRIEDAIIATEEIQQHAEANGARGQLKWMDHAKRLLDVKLSASKIQTRLLEARSITTWGEYLEKVKAILESIDECAQEVKNIQTSILLTIEAERQRQLCEGIKEVRETIDATIYSSMRHERTLTLRRRFESEAGTTFDRPSMWVDIRLDTKFFGSYFCVAYEAIPGPAPGLQSYLCY
ncbi:hypothetical protein DFH08DRAFT_934237 [Mycena albidolilacea]|uniref:Uncharacterized protein n=1 Tax=Mycena albidolilacea TaxID=1033008 RepID=A0AAD7AAP8_9AGAR|nr:hypothetical protein DFH08DRAFT_934237 [Mycena albidolilacea]